MFLRCLEFFSHIFRQLMNQNSKDVQRNNFAAHFAEELNFRYVGGISTEAPDFSCPLHDFFLLLEIGVYIFKTFLCNSAFYLLNHSRRDENTFLDGLKEPHWGIAHSLKPASLRLSLIFLIFFHSRMFEATCSLCEESASWCLIHQTHSHLSWFWGYFCECFDPLVIYDLATIIKNHVSVLATYRFTKLIWRFQLAHSTHATRQCDAVSFQLQNQE